MKIIDKAIAVEALRRGELVIIPTETVYGLAADAFNEKAVAKIFEAKGRPQKNPLILHVSDREMLQKCVQEIPVKAEVLMEKFWPGPLTLLFKKSNAVPDIVTAGLDMVCVRIPDHALTLELIQEVGRPLAAPSANISSRPSPTSVDAAMVDLEKRGVKFALDGEISRVGLESTVLDVTGEKPLILRLGGLGKEEIEAVLGEEVFIAHQKHEVKAPGMSFKHYAPLGEIILVYPWETFGEKLAKKLMKGSVKVTDNTEHLAAVEQAYAQHYLEFQCGIICTEERKSLYEGYEVLSLGSAKDVTVQARNLFKILLETEKLGWQKVIVDMTDIGGEKGLGPAIIERLHRASE
jgi:L-threonylcarbamoyladenylate synthase